MEIDGYNKENAICFEYQGQQHFFYVKHIQKKYENFLNQKRRDRIKKKIIKNHGILILYPDYKIKIIEYPYFILDSLKNTKFEKMIKCDAKSINVNSGFIP